jgi:multiple sugar transport system substrate-binding protein
MSQSDLSRPRWSRRSFLRNAGLVAGTLTGLSLLAACQPAAPPAAPTAAPAPPKPAAAPTSPPPAAGAPTAIAAAAKPAAAATTPPAAAAPVTLRDITLDVWTIKWGPDDMWPSVYRELKATTGITINPVLMPFTDIEPKVFTSLAGGVAPDLIYNHPVLNATFAQKNATLPLDDYIAKSKVIKTEDYFSSAINFFKWPAGTGKMYGFPVDYETNFYYYNKDLIAKAGLEDPAAIWKRDPKEWNTAKFAEYATKLSTGDGDSRVYGAAEISKSLRTQAPFLWGNGADIFSKDYKEAVFDAANAIPAWQFLADHVIKGWSPASAGREQAYPATMNPLFNGGRLGFYNSGRVQLYGFEQSLKLGMVPNPSLTAGTFTRTAPDAFAISVKTKDKDAAWAALEVFATFGNDKIIENKAGSPNRSSTLQSKVWKDVLFPWEDTDMFQSLYKTSRELVLPPRFSEIDTAAESSYDEIALGRQSAQDAMTSAKRKVDAILKEVMS